MLSVFQHFLVFQTLANANRISAVPGLPSFQAVRTARVATACLVFRGEAGPLGGGEVGHSENSAVGGTVTRECIKSRGFQALSAKQLSY